jgi:hypothetical protein
LVRRGQKLSEGFRSLLPNTRKKITSAVYRAWAGLAVILGRERLTHTEGMQLFQQFFGRGNPGISFLLTLFPAGSMTAETVHERLASLDTEEKLEAFLSQEPEPSPAELKNILTMINTLLPRLREILTDSVKQLPYDRGGRPEELASTEKQQQVRDEIQKLRGPGKKLKDIFRVIAERHGVSPSKIKQVWYGHNESLPGEQEEQHKASRSEKRPLPVKKR